jgi:hypothetical protein
LDEVETVVSGEEFGFGGVDVAGAGEAGEEENVGGGAAGCAFDDDGKAGGRSGDGLGGGLWRVGLAEERLAQQKDGCEEEEKREEAERGAGGALSWRGHDSLLIVSMN